MELQVRGGTARPVHSPSCSLSCSGLNREDGDHWKPLEAGQRCLRPRFPDPCFNHLSEIPFPLLMLGLKRPGIGLPFPTFLVRHLLESSLSSSVWTTPTLCLASLL